jgi:predicted O-methyltransferase YrrM
MSDKLDEYVLANSSPESPLLAELYRQTHLKLMNPRMVSGHIQGRFLSFISRMIAPKRILEIGTFTGYGTICLAEGLSKTGMIHTIDSDEEIIEFAKSYFERAGIKNKVTLHHGDARIIIPTLETKFQLIYIDGEKNEYPEYFKLAMNCLENGGFIVADNVLWNNKVIQSPVKNDKATAGIKQFNEMVRKDERVEEVILPFRDGLMLIQRIKE